MNNELQRKLYELEVTPPVGVWEKLSANIDEINADNLVAGKITGAEVLPPVSVWQKLSSSIDELNADNIIAKKMIAAEALPPAFVWEKINNALNPSIDVNRGEKGRIVNFRRLAAAAVVVGIIITAWFFIISNNNSTGVNVASVNEKPETKVAPNSGERLIDSPVKNFDILPRNTTTTIASVSPKVIHVKRNNITPNRKNKSSTTAHVVKSDLVALNNEIPGNKSFDRPIDDLSLVTSNDNYFTMVNANGRLVKIPAQLAQLAPHLQDKPLSEDIFEVMFGEGTYWKETMSEWRRKLISAPVSSGDAFTSFIELLKTVQDK